MATIAKVTPFGEKVGAYQSLSVPEVLYGPLFGCVNADHKHEHVRQNTYAILDAAKIKGLPEILESSGLEHRCLFDGEAYDDLKDVAPWLIRLEHDNRFTRHLFTDDGAPWHLWPFEAGIFLRSQYSLADLRHHFRKYTMLQIEDKGWCYFRFWEPKWSLRLISGMERKDADKFLSTVTQIIVVRSKGTAEVLTVNSGCMDDSFLRSSLV